MNRRFQTTLLSPVVCEGIGLHSGKPVRMKLRPAPANHGIVFKRTDVKGSAAFIPARYDLVADTRLGTTLKNARGVEVMTVEHLMAALWGANIDNALIELCGPEIPIMDGSSEPFMELIEEAGVLHLAAPHKTLRVLAPVEVRQGQSYARVEPYLGEPGACALDVTIDFPHKLISRQRAVYDFSEESFKNALARARTFGFEHEVEYLRAQGLARGGSLENAVVVGKDRILNAEGLRFGDEFLRHKALDCLGDLFLAGYRIEGRFTFERPGHAVNNALLHALMADEGAWMVETADEVMVPAVAHQQAVYACI